MSRSLRDRLRIFLCYSCLCALLAHAGPATAAKKTATRARPSAKRSPTKRGKPTQGKKRSRLPFPLANIKLPSNQSKLMRGATWRGVKAPLRRKTTKRKRLPLRRIKMAGRLAIKSRSKGWQASPGYIRARRTRRQTQVRGIGSDRRGREVRLVVYRRWLGRHGWNRRWQGHIFVMDKGKRRLKCPKKRFCHQLGRTIRRLLRAKPRHLNPAKPSFAWRLRRALERRHGFEIEVQVR